MPYPDELGEWDSLEDDFDPDINGTEDDFEDEDDGL